MQSANKDKGKSSVTVRRRYTASQVAEMLSYEQIPSDADDSEADVDEEDLEELNQLNSTAGCSSASRSASGCQHCYQQMFCWTTIWMMQQRMQVAELKMMQVILTQAI